jgi:two-component system chemotaxis sensor kinase CheA
MVLDPAAVRTIDGREMVTLRGSTLQLCRLSRLFGLEGSASGASNGWGPMLGPSGNLPRGQSGASRRSSRGARQYVVVAAVGSRRLGLVVDSLDGERDIVVSALGRSLKEVRGFAGASQLGDQRIALVIDAPLLVEEVHAAGDRGRQSPDSRSIHG